MMTGTSDPFARWTRIRRKGPFRFILLRGVLGWGLAAGTLYSLVMWALTDAHLRLLLPLSLVLFPAGGLLWGAAMWWFLERRYQREAPIEER
jgi:hypothetical protein